MRTHKLFRVLVLGASTTAAACGPAETGVAGPPPADTSPQQNDAAAPHDAASPNDASSPTDTAPSNDAGPANDAATVPIDMGSGMIGW